MKGVGRKRTTSSSPLGKAQKKGKKCEGVSTGISRPGFIACSSINDVCDGEGTGNPAVPQDLSEGGDLVSSFLERLSEIECTASSGLDLDSLGKEKKSVEIYITEELCAKNLLSC
ncbi:hypothetical protein K0M31_011380 [Melipona bicolor]|uniref:Uncharacterized protein n=1 Tax=Melipona bicolor TaxID=60889 RepID=A0AA40KUU5_9HYME|nr:hypothetical protein K0M31_011380 [Melipona bicolor]